MRKKTITDSLTASRAYSGQVKRAHTALDELTGEAAALGLTYGKYKALLSSPELLRTVAAARGINVGNCASVDELREALNDELWICDHVTGNASGSYTFSTWQAEEHLAHNWDVLEEACAEFGADMGEEIKKGAENVDVLIRCYFLGAAIDEVLPEFEEDFNAAHEEARE